MTGMLRQCYLNVNKTADFNQKILLIFLNFFPKEKG